MEEPWVGLAPWRGQRGVSGKCESGAPWARSSSLGLDARPALACAAWLYAYGLYFSPILREQGQKWVVFLRFAFRPAQAPRISPQQSLLLPNRGAHHHSTHMTYRSPPAWAPWITPTAVG